MPTPNESVLFDVNDAKIWPFINDNSEAPEYGAAIDVPGIASASMDPNFQTAELKGDATIIAKKGRLDKFNMSNTYGKLSMPVLGALLGGTVTGTEELDYRYKGGTPLPYFAYGVNMLDVDPGLGSVQVIVFKAQVTGGTLLGQSSDNFGQPTFDIEGISLSCIGSEWEGVMMAMRFFPVVTQLPDDPSSWTTGLGGTATGATAGNPGTFTPPGSTPPFDLANLGPVVASPATAWATGEHVVLGDASHAHWDASTWVVGDAVVLGQQEGREGR